MKIKSVTTIDSDGKTKSIQFYDDKGDLIREASLNDKKELQIDKELFYNAASQLIEERTYTTSGDVNTTSKYYYNNKDQLYKNNSVNKSYTKKE